MTLATTTKESMISVPVEELKKLEATRVALYELLQEYLSEGDLLSFTDITAQIWRVANTKNWNGEPFMKKGDEVYVVSIKLEGQKCSEVYGVYLIEDNAVREIKKQSSEKMWEHDKTFIEIITNHHYEVKFLENNDLILASYKIDKSKLV